MGGNVFIRVDVFFFPFLFHDTPTPPFPDLLKDQQRFTKRVWMRILLCINNIVAQGYDKYQAHQLIWHQNEYDIYYESSIAMRKQEKVPKVAAFGTFLWIIFTG